MLLCAIIAMVAANEAVLYHAPGDIHGLHFITAQEGWMTGREGAVYHTTDGGETFEKTNAGLDVLLTSVDFPDPGHGWAVGERGTILRTDDHGKTWTVQKSPVDYHLLSVFALGREEAWIVGDWGTMLHSRDGGRTWEDRSLSIPIEKAGPMEPVAAADVKDPVTGAVLVGKGELVGPEAREAARNKGIKILIREDVILNDLYFLNPYMGWIVGEAGLLLETRDGGRSFSRWVLGRGRDIYGPPPPSLYGVGFAPGSRGLAVGLMGTAYRIGVRPSPETVKSGTPKDLYTVSLNGHTVCIAGADGTAIVSDDGGRTFRAIKEKEIALTWLRRASAVDGVCFFGGEGGALLKVMTKASFGGGEGD